MTNKAVRRRRKAANKERPRKKRPKTFKTEESAKKYAEKKGIKEYTLENLRNPGSKDKKIRIKH